MGKKNGKHTHHIIPRHAGGTDEPENLVELTVEEHANAHLKLYEETNNPNDWCAYRLLSGMGERQFEIASLGGKIVGKRNAESGHMSAISKLSGVNFKHVDNEKFKNWYERNLQTMKEKRNNAFMDPEKRKEITKMGGAAQGKINAESGHCNRIAIETAKIRSEKMKNRIIINDGVHTRLIHPEERDQFPNWKDGRLVGNTANTIWITNGIKKRRIKQTEEIPDGWWRGCK